MTRLLEGSAQSCGCDEGANYYCREHRSGQLPGGNLPVTTFKPSSGDNERAFNKARPIYSGLMCYFPDALLEVAYVSHMGNEQHNPGEKLHWARDKSTDQLDAAGRHMVKHGKGIFLDGNDGYHLAKAAWRILAELQLHLEKTVAHHPV